MRSILKKIYTTLQKNKLASRLLFRFFAWAYIVSYHRLKDFIPRPDGKHPKHELIRYQEFFLGHIQPDDDVIDIGCHHGELTETLAEKANTVTGVDIDRTDIDICRDRTTHGNAEYVIADITTKEWYKKFDVAVLSNVLEHIKDRVGLLVKIAGLSSTLLIRVPLASRTWVALYLRDNGFEYRLDKTHETEYTEDEIAGELTEAGWTIEESTVRFGEYYAVCRYQQST